MSVSELCTVKLPVVATRPRVVEGAKAAAEDATASTVIAEETTFILIEGLFQKGELKYY